MPPTELPCCPMLFSFWEMSRKATNGCGSARKSRGLLAKRHHRNALVHVPVRTGSLMIGQFKTREHEIIGDIARAIVATPMSQRMEVLDAMTRAGFASVKAARPNDADQKLIATVVELQAKIVARAIELDPTVTALIGKE